jgi:protein BCP1
MQTASHPATKRQKGADASIKDSNAPNGGVYSFHPEDEYIQKVYSACPSYAFALPRSLPLTIANHLYFLHIQAASHSQNYSFTSAEPREKDAFGLDTGGRMMLVPAEKFRELVDNLCEAYAVPPQ